ncbi:helix-turn-helix domain-containing protein [Enterococcus sp. AZ194]|uniref:helix-turn-helix domain-containing protein n=1 Tax=Enterococcus sp. AZ194 TaxID=2774629 RepID=UPI003F6849AA
MAHFDYEKLRKLRAGKDWSLREMGEKLGVSKAAASRYETGDREPSLDMIEKIASLFELKTNDLIQNKMSLTEEYELTLRKEVLKEYAAWISAHLMKLLIRENITDDLHPLKIYFFKLAKVQNNKILYADDMEQLKELEGFLKESASYVDELVETMSKGNVA